MKWEYLVKRRIDFPHSDLVKSLNYFGKDKWELVTNYGDEFIFKRPRGTITDYRD